MKSTDAVKHSLLIVEDEECVRNELAQFFTCLGYSVRQAPDAPSALALFRDSPSRCVLSDYRMPGMNGLDLLKILHAEYPQTIAILLTGDGDNSVMQAALENGACACLIKPVPGSKIDALLRMHIAAADR